MNFVNYFFPTYQPFFKWSSETVKRRKTDSCIFWLALDNFLQWSHNTHQVLHFQITCIMIALGIQVEIHQGPVVQN